MGDVFISYASVDSQKANRLTAELDKVGIDYWIDARNIPKGVPYDDYIPGAISACNVVVMLISSSSLSSENVKNELRLAIDGGKTIIPFMLEDVELRGAFAYHIRANNRIAADRNWDQAIGQLLASLKGFTPVSAAVPSSGGEVKSRPRRNPEAPAKDIIDIRYGKNRIPVCQGPNGRYRILCRHCEAEWVDDNNSKLVEQKAENLREISATVALVIALLTLCIFFACTMSQEGEIGSIGVASWRAGAIGMLLAYICMLIGYFPKEICEKIYALQYPTKYTAEDCAKRFMCNECGETFTVKIPVGERDKFCYISRSGAEEKPFE